MQKELGGGGTIKREGAVKGGERDPPLKQDMGSHKNAEGEPQMTFVNIKKLSLPASRTMG